jgi:hypothetical protein
MAYMTTQRTEIFALIAVKRWTAVFGFPTMCNHLGEERIVIFIFYPKHGSDTFLRNVGKHLHDYRSSQPRSHPQDTHDQISKPSAVDELST